MDKLLQHYEQELGRLRHATRQYAEAHPATAEALELGPDASTDPEVERLLQSVALLNASMQKCIEENRREFHRALLQTLQPEYLRPMPACGIVQVDVPSLHAHAITTVGHIPRGAILRGGEQKFTTAYDVAITPFIIASAKFQPTLNLPATLRLPGNAISDFIITIESAASSIAFDQPPIPKLRIFVDAEPPLRAALLDAMLMRSLCISLELEGTWRVLAHSPFASAGIEAGESMLPCEPGPQSPRLLSELYLLPEKFSFVDLDLEGMASFCPSGCRRMSLHILLPGGAANLRQAHAKNFQLACTPVVNLFPQTAESILLDGRSECYPVVPRKPGCEIYSVGEVTRIDMEGEKAIPPFHGTNHSMPGPFWQLDCNDGCALRFVDREQRPAGLKTGTIGVQLMCTNKEISEYPGDLVCDSGSCGFPIRFLRGMAASDDVSEPGALCDALLGEDVSLPILCKMLELRGCKYTASLKRLVAKPATAWMHHPMGRVHMHGIEYTLVIDEAGLREHSIHTMAALLALTLADKLRENRFAQLRIANEDGLVLHCTEPQPGTRRLA
ncbi:type VI secretion system baseplate subunit TssF [Pseudoduganella sp.]|uniref:type VI secretion system baseplate subunit TssF n=1 Tax=Pseudoduganella sp. TaxID=1880898 RepID=UPI0035B14595